jgi:hypothetical protein
VAPGALYKSTSNWKHELVALWATIIRSFQLSKASSMHCEAIFESWKHELLVAFEATNKCFQGWKET